MKLAYVYDAVYPWEPGGVQKRVWELARRLADRHDVHWFGLRYWDGPAVTTREGVTLHGVAEPMALYAGDRRSVREAVAFAARVLDPLRREGFDLVDCQEFPYFPVLSSRVAASAGRASLLVTWHEVWGDYWREYLGRAGVAGRAVERLAALVPDAHVAVSERTRREVAGLGAAAELVPNGVDVDRVREAPPADERVDVLFVGRFIPQKNPTLLVRALTRLRRERSDLRCVLVGDGPEREAARSLAAAVGVGDDVDFRDGLAYDEVLGLMRAADAFALPSVREGFGVAALEAMAAGTPVVTVDHPRNAAADLVADGRTGVVCATTPDALAAAVRDAWALDGGPCVAAAREYDWGTVAADAESVYREAVN